MSPVQGRLCASLGQDFAANFTMAIRAASSRKTLGFPARSIGLRVEPIYLLDLASQQERWLTVRQAVVAQNIANANTPGYTAMDVGGFQDVFDGAQLQLASTSPAHMGIDPLDPGSAASKEESPWEVSNSGNSVSLEQEMLKAGQVNRDYSLNTSVVKAFNQMLSASVKG